MNVQTPKLPKLLLKEVHNNLDVTLIITGKKKGIGKSSLMLWLAKYCNPNLTDKEIINNMSWLPKDWLKCIATRPPYTVIGFDEVGNAWGNKRYKEEINMMISETQQSDRFLNQIKILTLPNLLDLNTTGRRTACWYIHIVKRGMGIFYELSINQFKGYIMPKKKAIIYFPQPPEELYNLYEIKKRKIETGRYKERIERITEIEEQKKSPLFRASKYFIENKNKVLDNNEVDPRYLSAMSGVSSDIGYQVKKVYEKDGLKGINFLLNRKITK